MRIKGFVATDLTAACATPYCFFRCGWRVGDTNRVAMSGHIGLPALLPCLDLASFCVFSRIEMLPVSSCALVLRQVGMVGEDGSRSHSCWCLVSNALTDEDSRQEIDKEMASVLRESPGGLLLIGPSRRYCDG